METRIYTILLALLMCLYILPITTPATIASLEIEPTTPDLVVVVNSTAPACTVSPDNLYFSNLTSALTYLNTTGYDRALVYICPGIYAEEGSSNQFYLDNITVKGYNSKPVLVLNTTTNSIAINGSNIVFRNLEFNLSKGNIVFIGENITVENISIEAYNIAALVFSNAKNIYVGNVNITNTADISSKGIYLEDVVEATIEDVVIREIRYGIQGVDSGNITIRDVEIDNITYYGIYLYDDDGLDKPVYINISDATLSALYPFYVLAYSYGIYIDYDATETSVSIKHVYSDEFTISVVVTTTQPSNTLVNTITDVESNVSLCTLYVETAIDTYVENIDCLETQYGVIVYSTIEDAEISVKDVYVDVKIYYTDFYESIGLYVVSIKSSIRDIDVVGEYTEDTDQYGVYVVSTNCVMDNITVTNKFHGLVYTPTYIGGDSLSSTLGIVVKRPSGVIPGVNKESSKPVIRQAEGYSLVSSNIYVDDCFLALYYEVYFDIEGGCSITGIEARNSTYGFMVTTPAMGISSSSPRLSQEIASIYIGDGLFYNNTFGFLLESIAWVSVKDINASYNNYGVYVYETSNTSFRDVVAVGNSVSDIVLEDSYNITFENIVVTQTRNKNIEVKTSGDTAFNNVDEEEFADLLKQLPTYWIPVMRFNITVSSGSWVYIVYKYSDRGLASMGISEDTLALMHYNETISEWEKVAPVMWNKDENYIVFNLTSGSPYALGGSPPIVGGEIIVSNIRGSASITIPLLASLTVIAVLLATMFLSRNRVSSK